MDKKNRVRSYLAGIIFVLYFIIGCTTIPVLNIEYRLPEQNNVLVNKKVSLVFEDKRSPKELFSQTAQREFGTGNEAVSLYLGRGKDPAFKMGIYEVPTLYKEVFRRRLIGLGLEVAPENVSSPLGILIVLKKFYLDSQGRDWKAQIEYEGRLMKDGSMLSQQTITGEATRLRLFGQTQANILMSDLFSDAINKLDIIKLFEQANIK